MNNSDSSKMQSNLCLLQGSRMGVLAMVRRVYQREGIRGFYRVRRGSRRIGVAETRWMNNESIMVSHLQGVTASYAGISETVIQFVLYEYLRQVCLCFTNLFYQN